MQTLNTEGIRPFFVPKKTLSKLSFVPLATEDIFTPRRTPQRAGTPGTFPNYPLHVRQDLDLVSLEGKLQEAGGLGGKLTQILKEGGLSVQYCFSLINHSGTDSKCQVTKDMLQTSLYKRVQRARLCPKEPVLRSQACELQKVNQTQPYISPYPFPDSENQIFKPSGISLPGRAKNHGQISKEFLKIFMQATGLLLL